MKFKMRGVFLWMTLFPLSAAASDKPQTLTVTGASCDGDFMVCEAQAYTKLPDGKTLQMDMTCRLEDATCLKLRYGDTYAFDTSSVRECRACVEGKGKLATVVIHGRPYDVIYTAVITETGATPTPPPSDDYKPETLKKAERLKAAQQPEQATTAEQGGPANIYKVGGKVTAPKALYTPDPQYTREALKANLRGKVTLSCVVGGDGHVYNVLVLKSLGKGLDEQAVNTVQKWTFQPATKDQQPVAVQITVDVQFKTCTGSPCTPY